MPRKKKIPKDALSDDKLKDYLAENHEELGGALVANGLSEAFIGVCYHEREPVVVYDTNKVLDILMKRDEMTREEAIEFFEFNIAGFKDGSGRHPIFVTLFPEDWKK